MRHWLFSFLLGDAAPTPAPALHNHGLPWPWLVTFVIVVLVAMLWISGLRSREL